MVLGLTILRTKVWISAFQPFLPQVVVRNTFTFCPHAYVRIRKGNRSFIKFYIGYMLHSGFYYFLKCWLKFIKLILWFTHGSHCTVNSKADLSKHRLCVLYLAAMTESPEFCYNDCLELQAWSPSFCMCLLITTNRACIHVVLIWPPSSIRAGSPGELRLEIRMQLNRGPGSFSRPHFSRASRSRSFWLRGEGNRLG